jgi:bacteriorhodopsin
MPWLRYVGWLITCPVLLIHLGNLTVGRAKKRLHKAPGDP